MGFLCVAACAAHEDMLMKGGGGSRGVWQLSVHHIGQGARN